MPVKIKKLVLNCFLPALAGIAFGQVNNVPQNCLVIRIGADHHRFIDQAFTSSRLKFTGTSFSTASPSSEEPIPMFSPLVATMQTFCQAQ